MSDTAVRDRYQQFAGTVADVGTPRTARSGGCRPTHLEISNGMSCDSVCSPSSPDSSRPCRMIDKRPRQSINGLRRDEAAVRNGLTLPHSSGAVEGSVNRMKMIKRQMYGRAGFNLLHKRVLLAH